MISAPSLAVSLLGPIALICAIVALVSGRVVAAQLRRRFDANQARLCRQLETIECQPLPTEEANNPTPTVEVGTAIDRVVHSLRCTVETMRWSVTHDPLTGLLNAAGFKSECEAAGIQKGALLFCDLNDFKKVNDALGHAIGDLLIRALAERLKVGCTSSLAARAIYASAQAGEQVEASHAIVGRLSGDEFAVYLPGVESREDVERFAQLLFRLMDEPCHLGSHVLRATIAIGAAFFSMHHSIYDQTLAAADTAMYAAKSDAGNALRFFAPEMRNCANRILEEEIALRNAIVAGELCLYFQPQLDVSRNLICGAEALVRWDHPVHGMMLPGRFVSFAEKYGLIRELGDWVTESAIETAARWNRMGRPLRLSINVSPMQIISGDFIPHLRACLHHYNLPPHLLELEFTEQTAMDIDELLFARLQSLRAEGVTIALDDFGTGYSNLAQLLCAPIDRIKLDQSLLEATGRSKNARLVVLSAVRLARQMSVEVVAEGVETDRQLQFLRRIHCHVAQGFLIGRPVPESEFLKVANAFQNPETRMVRQCANS